MPPVQLLPSPRVNPYAQENSKAFMSMMNILSSTEVARRKEIMTRNVLEAIARGSGREGISEAALMQPGYSGGIAGLLQKIASPFADQATGIDDIIAGRGIETAMRDPLEVQGMQADLDYKTARTKYYNQPRPVSATQRIAERKWKMIEAAAAKGDTKRVDQLMSIRSDEQSLDEQIKTWQTLQNAAAGQYYAPGLEGGATAPKNQKVYDLATKKLNELLAERDGETGKTKTGAKKTLDADTAAKILQEAGGDKEKARQLAKERGYTF